MLGITGNKGFQMTFSNGNTVSVQFGYGNYCENKLNEEVGALFNPEPHNPQSSDAEVAAWSRASGDGEGERVWYNFGHDTVAGWLNADEVASFITFVATSDLNEDRWEKGQED